MSGIFEWVRSLVFYMILMTMVVNLLPDKKYEKYLQLFVGIVFLMLVFSPFADLGGAEAKMEEAFSRLTFENDAKMLRREIEDADGERMRKLVEHYEDAIEMDMRTMAEGTGVQCVSVEVQLEENLESGAFGRVVSVDMVVAEEKSGEVAVAAVNGLALKSKNTRVKEIGELRARIGEYYGLKESEITIHLENE